jgi:hypothetical protein
MARTVLTPIDLVPNGSVADGVGTTLDVTNGMVVEDADPEHLIIRASNTDDDTNLNVVIKAGDYPPALAAGQGDLTVTVAFGTVRTIIVESGRFLRKDGSVQIDATVNTGKIWVFRRPRGA